MQETIREIERARVQWTREEEGREGEEREEIVAEQR